MFFALAPGVVAGVVPWWLTGWDAEPARRRCAVLGVALIAAGAAVLLHAFARFVREGVGTPAPVAPTAAPGRRRALPLRSATRCTCAVVACVMGQALLLEPRGPVGLRARC